jgi:spermidine/putrescine transport system permease protein
MDSRAYPATSTTPGRTKPAGRGYVGAALLTPPGLLLGALFVLPIVLMLSYSFWALNDQYQIVPIWNLDQYRLVLGDGLYLRVLLNSAWLALLTTLICLVLAFPLAYYIARICSPKYRALLLVALIVPGWISVLIRTYAWNMVIGESGLLNYLLMSAGIVDTPVPILFTQTAVVIGLVYIYLPYMLVPVYVSLERLDQSVLEAAENLGAGAFSRLWRVIVPLTLPGIVAGSIITFVPALGEYLVPNLLGGLRGQMYGNLITQAFADFNWPLGATLGVVLFAAVIVLLVAVGRLISIDRIMAAGR